MQYLLKQIVEQLAIPGFRRADGESWPVCMEFVQQLIADSGFIPDVFLWQDAKSRTYKNFTVTIPGITTRKIIIGAHYDSFEQTPGADDNASSVAVLIGLLYQLKKGYSGKFTLDIKFYACEEPPYFGTQDMGSFKDASLQNRDEIELMICLEMVGFYSDESGSQSYPYSLLKWIYGSRGNYLLCVSNASSFSTARKYIRFLQQCRNGFYRKIMLPFRLSGLDWSDHRSYWKKGIPAIMLTDTAMFRNAHYHTDKDIPAILDYEKMQHICDDLYRMVNNTNW